MNGDVTSDEVDSYLSASPTPSGGSDPMDSEVNSYLGVNPGGSQPETSAALSETETLPQQLLRLAKAPSPPWLRPFERTVREVATTPALPSSKQLQDWRASIGIPDQPAAGAHLVESIYDPLAKFATLQNVALGAAYAVQPEIGAALTAATLAPQVKPWWQRVKQLPYATPEEGLALGLETWPLAVGPFIHGDTGGFTPVTPRPSYKGLEEIPPEQAPPPEQAAPPQKPGVTPMGSEELRQRYGPQAAPEVAAAPQPRAAEETPEQTEIRTVAAMKKLRDLGGDWQAIHKNWVEEHGTQPTDVEFANELEDEIKDLTRTPEEALRSYTYGIARKRGMTPEELLAETEAKRAAGIELTLQEARDAELSRKELEEEKKQPRGGRYASRKPSTEEMVFRSQGGGMVPQTPFRQPREVTRTEKPVSPSVPLAPKAPESAYAPGHELELRNRAEENVRKALKLPKDKVELVKMQEAETAPTPDELARAQEIEYQKLKRAEAAPPSEPPPKTEAVASPPPTEPAAPSVVPGQELSPADMKKQAASARKTAYKKVADGYYEHKQTGLIIRHNKATGMHDVVHPKTGEVLDSVQGRRNAMDKHIEGLIPEKAAGAVKEPAPSPGERDSGVVKPGETDTPARIASQIDLSDISGWEKGIEQIHKRKMTDKERAKIAPYLEMYKKTKAEAARISAARFADVLKHYKGVKDIPFDDAVQQIKDAITDATKDCL